MTQGNLRPQRTERGQVLRTLEQNDSVCSHGSGRSYQSAACSPTCFTTYCHHSISERAPSPYCALSAVLGCGEEKKPTHTSQGKDHGKKSLTFSTQHKEATLRRAATPLCWTRGPRSLAERVGTPPPLPKCLRVPVSHLASSSWFIINSLGKFSG